MKRRGPQQNTITQEELDEFLSAITSHDFDTTSRILTTYPFLVRYKDELGATPLHIVATVLDEKIIKLLLDNGADVNSVDSQGLTPLHNASLCNAVGREDGRPFIEYAAESFKTLLEGGANPNAQTTDGLTPLHVLVSSGTAVNDEVLSSLASVLIDSGADPIIENTGKQTALDLIIQDRREDIEYSLKTINQDRENQEPPQLRMTAEEETKLRQEKTKEMLESPLIQYIGEAETSGDLIRAIKANDHDEISRIITDHPEALKFQGQNGDTPLHIALAEKGCSVETVDLVYKAMEVSDRTNIRNKHGISAQDMVNAIAYIAKKPILQKKMEILDRDPQLVFVKTRDGKTLIDEELKLNKELKPEDIAQGYFLMRLIDNNEQEAAVSLIRTNPHLANFRDSNGDSLLHHAIHSSGGKLSSVATALFESGANPDIPNENGFSARDTIAGYELMTFSSWNHHNTGTIDIKRLEKILKKTPKLKDFRDFEESTLLHSAVYTQDPKVIDLLLDKGLDINARDNGGRTPLHNLATSLSGEGYAFDVDNSALLLQKLIKKNADIEAKDNDGNTFLHAMAISGVGLEDLEKLVNKLYLYKDILNIQNNDGKTCKDIVEELKRKPDHREISADRASVRDESSEKLVSLSSDSGKSVDTPFSSDSRKSSTDSLLPSSSPANYSLWSNIERGFSSTKSYLMSFLSLFDRKSSSEQHTRLRSSSNSSSDGRQSSSSFDYQDVQSGSRSTSVSDRGKSSVNAAEFYSFDGGSASRNPSAESRESSKVSVPRSPKSTAINYEDLAAMQEAFDALYVKGEDGSLVGKSTRRTSSSHKLHSRDSINR